jgi:hypothetical protein
MAACANHPDVQATAFCRTCGKPLCDQCKKEVRGVVYCEDCLVAHLQNVMPPPASAGVPAPGMPYVDPQTGYVRPPGTPNPTLAAFLGFIPGVGAFYNGQYQKGVVHVLMFPILIMLTDRADYFGVLIPFYFFYMAWDAYRTARSRVTGEPVPDPLGINNLFGLEGSKEDPVAVVEPGKTSPKGTISGVPVGALVLIGLGIMFLVGDYNREIFRNFVPIALIAIGVWKGIQVWERTAR